LVGGDGGAASVGGLVLDDQLVEAYEAGFDFAELAAQDRGDGSSIATL
jgi:hypothetical protein